MDSQENWQDFEANGGRTFFEILNNERYDDFKRREKAIDDMIAAKEEQKKRKQQREARERAKFLAKLDAALHSSDEENCVAPFDDDGKSPSAKKFKVDDDADEEIVETPARNIRCNHCEETPCVLTDEYESLMCVAVELEDAGKTNKKKSDMPSTSICCE
jgi:hypothetical protein